MLLTKEELYNLYWNEGRTQCEIANIAGCHQAVIWRWMKRYDIPTKGIYAWNRGLSTWRKGKTLEEEYGSERAKEIRYKQSLAKKGKPMSCSPKGLIRSAEAVKKLLIFQKPNKAEQKAVDIIQQAGLPFKYVGNGEFVLGGKCPDFLNINGKKQVIELFGAHWHPIFDVALRTEHFRQYGFETLVIWEDELKDPKRLTHKIKVFSRNYVPGAISSGLR